MITDPQRPAPSTSEMTAVDADIIRPHMPDEGDLAAIAAAVSRHIDIDHP